MLPGDVMKRYQLLLHRYLGLACAVFLLLVGLSGSALVFKKEIETATGLRPALAATQAPYQAFADTVLARYPNASFSLRFGAAGEAVQARVRLDDESRRLWLDGGSARIVSDTTQHGGLFNWLFALHDTLLLGENGNTAVGVLGLLLLLLTVSGVVYWWPRDWQRAFVLRRDKGLRVLVTDLHRLAGMLLCVPLAISALTGAMLVFNKPIKGWLNGWYGGTPSKVKVAMATTPRLPLDELVRAANLALPGGEVTDIQLEQKKDKPLVVRKRLLGEIHPYGRSLVDIDPYRGTVLRAMPVDVAEPAIRLQTWVYPFHIGSAGGVAHRILQLLAGLGVAALGGSGVYQWLARRHKQRQARLFAVRLVA